MPKARTEVSPDQKKSPRRNLGVNDLAEIWAKVTPAAEGSGLKLATDELRAVRKERRGAGLS
jgi:hypothetical protein